MNTPAILYRLLAAQLISTLSISTSQFTLSLWLYQTTGGAVWVAVLSAARIIPTVYLGLFTGQVIDRVSRQLLMSVSHAGAVLSAGGLAIVLLYYPDVPPLVVGVIFLSALFESTASLGLTTMIPEYVRRSNYDKYNGLLSAIRSFPFVAAPFIGAELLSSYPIHSVAFAGAGGAILAFLLVLSTEFHPVLAPSGRRGTRRRILEGVLEILRNPLLRKLQIMSSAYNFFNGLAAGFLTVYLYARLQEPSAVATASMIGTLGLLLGGVSGVACRDTRYRVVLMAGLMLFAATTGRIALPLLGGSLLLGGALLARNLSSALFNALSDSIWQGMVEQGARGRTFGARRFLGQGLFPVALLVGGWVCNYLEECQFVSGGDFETTAALWAMSTVLVGSGLLESAVAIMMFQVGLKYSQGGFAYPPTETQTQRGSAESARDLGSFSARRKMQVESG